MDRLVKNRFDKNVVRRVKLMRYGIVLERFVFEHGVEVLGRFNSSEELKSAVELYRARQLRKQLNVDILTVNIGKRKRFRNRKSVEPFCWDY